MLRGVTLAVALAAAGCTDIGLTAPSAQPSGRGLVQPITVGPIDWCAVRFVRAPDPSWDCEAYNDEVIERSTTNAPPTP